MEDASRFLVDRFRGRLIAHFLTHRFQHSDAEDLVQEVFDRAFRGIAGLREEKLFEAWLARITRNVRSSAQTSRRSRVEGSEPVEEVEVAASNPGSDPLRTAITTDELDRVWRAVDRLPPQQRQCLLLRAVREMSYEEIAKVLQLSVRTVRNHLHEARSNLKSQLRDQQ